MPEGSVCSGFSLFVAPHTPRPTLHPENARSLNAARPSWTVSCWPWAWLPGAGASSAPHPLPPALCAGPFAAAWLLLPGVPAPPTPGGITAPALGPRVAEGSLGTPVPGDCRFRAASWGWRCWGSLGVFHSSLSFSLGCMVGQARGVPPVERRRMNIRAQEQGGPWTVTAKGRRRSGGHPGALVAQMQRLQGGLGGVGAARGRGAERGVPVGAWRCCADVGGGRGASPRRVAGSSACACPAPGGCLEVSAS